MIDSNVNDVLLRVGKVTEFLGIQLSSVNQVGIFGNTPLSVTITWGDYEAANLLVAAGANVNAEVEAGNTALHHAVLFNQLKIVELLLEHGASRTASNRDGQTPLELAKILGYEGAAQLLNI